MGEVSRSGQQPFAHGTVYHGCKNSRIGLVRFSYLRETSSNNPSEHRTGVGCAYGSPAASVYRIWGIANAAG